MGGVRLLRETGVDVNVLSVLTSQMAAHPQRLLLHQAGGDYAHPVIPRPPGLDDEHDAFSLAPREFSSFYRRLFDLWWRELGAGNYVSIWLFENIMQMALGQFPSQCGMLGRCAPQFVVESDGSVYPCDFYALDEYRVGDIRNDDLVGHVDLRGDALVFAGASSRLLAVRGLPLRGHVPSQLQALEHRVLRRGVLRPA